MNTGEKFIINGGKALFGDVRVSGAKNAVLVQLAALLLADGVSVLHNVPDIADVHGMIELLQFFGAQVVFDIQAHIVTVDTTQVSFAVPPAAMLTKFRASILITGALLTRFGASFFTAPGGCPIGERPINLHMHAFKSLGADEIIDGERHSIVAPADGLVGALCIFDYPSVGATENALLAAICAKGRTAIYNAALEPEIFDLVNMLRSMGANISYDVPAMIIVEGVERTELAPANWTVLPDRLEAGTWLYAAAITGGNVSVHDAPIEHMYVVLQQLDQMGHVVEIDEQNGVIRLQGSKKYNAVSCKTMPHPGFPTDLQSPLIALLSCAQGVGKITETVYENRFLAVESLCTMGAKIVVSNSTATITGVDDLIGGEVEGKDIRASAALMIAGLRAQGVTHVSTGHHLARGYERFVEKAQALGADITLVK